MYIADLKRLNETMTSRGFLYGIAFVIISFISIIKCIICLIHDFKYRKYRNAPSLFRKLFTDEPSTNELVKKMRRYKDYEEATRVEEPKDEGLTKEQKARQEAKQLLMDYLLQSNYSLKGEVIKMWHPKSTLEQIQNSEKPYFIQRITFGNDLNNALHTAYGYTLRRSRATLKTYLELTDEETFDLQKRIQDEFYNDEAYVLLVDTSNKK